MSKEYPALLKRFTIRFKRLEKFGNCRLQIEHVNSDCAESDDGPLALASLSLRFLSAIYKLISWTCMQSTCSIFSIWFLKTGVLIFYEKTMLTVTLTTNISSIWKTIIGITIDCSICMPVKIQISPVIQKKLSIFFHYKSKENISYHSNQSSSPT